jgi:transposase
MLEIKTQETEVSSNARRRTFSAEYRLRIVREADACAQRGEVGALLRREGLYSSHLTAWRREIEQRNLKALAPKKRGPKVDPRAAEIAELMRENEKLKARAERAELLVEIQKKVASLLGIPLATSDGKPK